MSDIAIQYYIMHKTIHSRKRETYIDYRINIAEAILQNVQLSDYKMHAKSALKHLFDSWVHFPKNIDLV